MTSIFRVESKSVASKVLLILSCLCNTSCVRILLLQVVADGDHRLRLPCAGVFFLRDEHDPWAFFYIIDFTEAYNLLSASAFRSFIVFIAFDAS